MRPRSASWPCAGTRRNSAATYRAATAEARLAMSWSRLATQGARASWHKGFIGRAGCGVRTSRLGRKMLKPSMRSRWLLNSSLRRSMTPAVSILHTGARNSLRFGPRFGRNPRIRSNACPQACSAPPVPEILQGFKKRAIHVLVVGKAVLDLFDVRERCTNTACRACVEASTTQRHQPT